MSLKTEIIIIFVIVLMLAIIVGIYFWKNNQAGDIAKISDREIILLLRGNMDAGEYIKSYPDFKINKKEVLTKESILAGQNGQNFKEVYQGLELENSRYLKVDLINGAGDRGLISVIDFKEKKVLKSYGLILLSAGVKK